MRASKNDHTAQNILSLGGPRNAAGTNCLMLQELTCFFDADAEEARVRRNADGTTIEEYPSFTVAEAAQLHADMDRCYWLLCTSCHSVCG